MLTDHDTDEVIKALVTLQDGKISIVVDWIDSKLTSMQLAECSRDFLQPAIVSIIVHLLKL